MNKNVSINQNQFSAWAARMLTELDWSKPWEFTWKRFRVPRSLDQNALWHVWFQEVAEHISSTELLDEDGTPYTVDISADEVKHLCKSTLGYSRQLILGSKEVTLVKDTRDYTHEEGKAFQARVQAWAATDLNLELKIKEKNQS